MASAGGAAGNPTQIRRYISLFSGGIYGNVEVRCACGQGVMTYTQPLFFTEDNVDGLETLCRKFHKTPSCGNPECRDNLTKEKVCAHCHSRSGCCTGSAEDAGGAGGAAEASSEPENKRARLAGKTNIMCFFWVMPPRIFATDHHTSLIRDYVRDHISTKDEEEAREVILRQLEKAKSDERSTNAVTFKFFCPCVHCMGHYSDEAEQGALLRAQVKPLIEDTVHDLCHEHDVTDQADKELFSSLKTVKYEGECATCSGFNNTYTPQQAPVTPAAQQNPIIVSSGESEPGVASVPARAGVTPETPETPYTKWGLEFVEEQSKQGDATVQELRTDLEQAEREKKDEADVYDKIQTFLAGKPSLQVEWKDFIDKRREQASPASPDGRVAAGGSGAAGGAAVSDGRTPSPVRKPDDGALLKDDALSEATAALRF